MTENETDLENLLSRHLAGKLDPKIGKAEQAFTRLLDASHQRRRVGRWIFGAALAASMVAASGLSVRAWWQDRPVRTEQTRVSPIQAPRPTLTASKVEHLVMWQVRDEGIVALPEGNYVRQYRRQVLDASQWYDPQTQTLTQRAIPHEQVLQIELQTY